jgi:uncharacterized membrane-anchored protein
MSSETEERNAGVQKPGQTPKTLTEMEQQLTKKNEDYMFHLKKALAETKLSPEKQAEAYQEMLPQLIQGQKHGQTARQQFGTVTTRVADIISGPKKDNTPTSNRWLITLDNSMMIFMIFSLLYGITGYIGSEKAAQNSQMGLVSLILIAVVAGFGTTELLNLVSPDKTKHIVWWRVILYAIAMVVGLMALYALTNLIPSVANPTLPSWLYLVLGIIVLFVRIYVKKRYNITGTMF